MRRLPKGWIWEPGGCRMCSRWGIGVVVFLALLLSSSTASAEFRHTSIAAEFGPDGTSGTQFSAVGNVAYQQANKRIYLQISGGANIYGFSNPSAGTFTPLGGAFPLSTGCCGGDPDITVDNTAGASKNNIYYTNDENQIHGLDETGAGLAGWPVNAESEDCGVAVDNAGHVWGGNWGGNRILEFAATGGSRIGEFSTSATGNVCKLAVDPTNNDLYLDTWNGPVNRYTASSGYTEHQLIDPGEFASNADRLTVNGAAHKLYVAHSGVIIAYSTTTGEPVEEITVGANYHGIAVNESNDTLYVFRESTQRVAEMRLNVVPKAITGEPTGNKKVSGEVAPDGAGTITECYFEFGLTKEYGSTAPCTPGVPISEPKTVEAELPGVEGEKTYHYRVVAATATPGSINFGVDKTITPHNVHGLLTDPATEVTRTTAMLHAHYEGTGLDTHYYFEWGTEPCGEAGCPNKSATPPGTDDGIHSGLRTLAYEATELTPGTTYYFRVVAENSEGVSKGNERTFTTPPAVSNVETEAATNVTTTSATLNGSFDIDPGGPPLEGGDTHYYFEFGQTTSYGGKTAAPPGEDAGSEPGHKFVSSTIEVQKGTTYHFRIVVTNELGTVKGNDQTFTTPQPPTIVGVTSANVTATTADLIAQINPHSAETKYRFEYGLTPSYEHVVPIPDGPVEPTGESNVKVEQHISGLEVGATYHFHVVAHNQYGEVASADQTFSFFTPNCPNAHIRQQTGAAYLPDCRAYELVSPANAGAVQLFVGEGTGPFGEGEFGRFTSQNRGASGKFTFFGGIGQVTGTNPPNITQDLYLAERTSAGWITHYPGLESSQTLWAGGTECDEAMDRCINYDNPDPLQFNPNDKGSAAPYVFAANANSQIIGRFPTNVGEVENGEKFIGEGIPSGDFTHFLFSSRNIAFAEGGLTTAPGSVYDNDVAANPANSETIISKLTGGANIPAGVGGPEEFIKIPAVSSDGSHVLMSTQGEKGVILYMTVGDTLHFEVSEGKGVNFVGMTRDGSKVFFTTEEQLGEPGEDTDESVDLYVWEEATGSARVLSVGSLGSGNTDECSAGWITKCNVEPVAQTIDHKNNVPVFVADNTFAENGDIYFYSPELLDGTGNGFGNARNLYVYRNGHPQYVTTLGNSSGAAVRRMDINPDDSRVAFVTSTMLTGYENAGRREMYTFDPGEPQKGLTCVSCIPTGAEPTSDVVAAASGRFMADDGRTFYSTKDALVPFDTDGVIDVYEYVDGRPQLISSGTAQQDTWGGGLLLFPEMSTGLEAVSADGVDVIFSTFQSLVPQDGNGEFIKFYDARTGGGFPVPEPPPPCKAADECHVAGSTPPAAPQVGTGAQLGTTGNVKHHRKKRHHRKKKHHHRRHRRHGGHRHG